MSIRCRILSIVAIVIAAPSAAHSQQNLIGGSNTSPYMQNYYNRNTQPLSPYLNLLRGGNAATNYYYGVRPGTTGGPLGTPFSMSMGAQGRQTFFPQIDTLADLEDTKPTDGIRPTGHPFGFNNGLGYFGSAGGQSAMGQQRGPRRSTTGR